MSAIDKLLDFINQQSLRTTTMPTAAQVVMMPTKVDGFIEEMRIIPDTPNGPMLEIVTKSKDGIELFKQRFNLVAVDDLIGKLIKHRDLMAAMKESGDERQTKM